MYEPAGEAAAGPDRREILRSPAGPETVSAAGVAVADLGEPAALTDDYVVPRVMLVMEGTYPFHWGGVSTWCDHLIRGLPEVPFATLAISTQPDLTPVFDRPGNIVDFRAVPLWGLKDPAEAERRVGARLLHRTRRRTTEATVRAEFLPALRGFLEGLFRPQCDARALADCIHQIYRFLSQHDFNRALRSRPVWEMSSEVFGQAAEAERARSGGAELTLQELTTAFQWLCRWLFPLARPLPEVDVVHAAMAGPCSIVCAAVQREFGAGYFLTEHGVYLRERYIAESSRTDSYFLKFVGLSFARRITEMSYVLADQISPCCDYNQRWELQVGASAEQLQTIYYAVDDDAYRSTGERPADPTTVVWVGRINPLKDVETLLRAAAHVAARIPGARFLLYGSAPAEDAEYHARCLALHRELCLEGVVTFCGYTSDPAAAYNSGDIVVLSSVSEGFPYSTLEAMLCGRPIVATSVGGIPEQIGSCGIIVEPRDPEAMGEALVSLLDDPERCHGLGAAARHRASSVFGMGGFVMNHLTTYQALAPRARPEGTARALAVVGEDADPVPSADGTTSLQPLVAKVRARTSRPVDDLEVAAILESGGMTDEKARSDHGYPDAFRLATSVYDRVRQAPDDEPPSPTSVPPHEPAARPSHLDNVRHPVLALLPSIALLGVLWALTSVGRWPPERVLATGLGMTLGMLFTNGVTIAMAPRASALISFGRIPLVRVFLATCTAIAVACTAAVAEVVLALHWAVLSFLNRETPSFLIAAAALSVVWCLAGALSLVALSGWTGTALSAGILSALALDRLLQVWPAVAGPVAVLTGAAVTISMLLTALERELRTRIVEAPTKPRLPSIGYMVLEALPYYLYGTLGVAMVVSVHVVGWASIQHGSGSWGHGVATLELGLFLPLPPAALMAAQAERTLRRFWRAAGDLQAVTAAADAQDFSRRLDQVYRENARRYVQRLTLASVVVLTGVAAAAWISSRGSGWGEHPGPLLTLVATGLVGYGLLGWAQFNAMFGMSLLAWRGPLRAVATGSVTTIATAIVLIGLAGYAAAGAALVLGAAAYALLARQDRRRLLGAADFHYVMAV